MLSLTEERFSAARSFLLTRARPLERALYLHNFADWPAYEVLEALKQFQNEDGGFGQAIEPDFRLPESSALGTSIGLQTVSHLRLSEAPKVALRAMQYLQSTYDGYGRRWEPVPASIVDHPRALWWGPETRDEWEGHWANPGAELVGYFYEFPSDMPDGLRDALTERAFQWLDALAEPLEMHDLLCYLRLAERLPAELQTKLYAELKHHVMERVATNAAAWETYGLQPLQVAPSPDAHFYPLLASAISDNLDFLIRQQQEDGAWVPAWAWGRYEDEWTKAKVEWMGILTLEHLQVLTNYDRVVQ